MRIGTRRVVRTMRVATAHLLSWTPAPTLRTEPPTDRARHLLLASKFRYPRKRRSPRASVQTPETAGAFFILTPATDTSTRWRVFHVSHSGDCSAYTQVTLCPVLGAPRQDPGPRAVDGSCCAQEALHNYIWCRRSAPTWLRGPRGRPPSVSRTSKQAFTQLPKTPLCTVRQPLIHRGARVYSQAVTPSQLRNVLGEGRVRGSDYA